ncbi:protein of unknown function [Flavobacterium fontis]|uniref:DUF4407 domain-containing protein n=1 Tax=Flavobacterium fontis TaxID=1124188 RepID=A0A1M5CDW1_9FLAO|nr:DUF4407 domain-containing protein [Flavobacterium fontis]SHF52891.1 protein of unknown function [Flavobacterium fontis]
MNKKLSDIRLFLFTCSGEDNYILKRCNWGIQKRFALIGFFVLLIFIGCFFSATLFCISLFQRASLLSVFIGIFWGAMVVNMYLLLLHTISPAIIPSESKKKRNKKAVVENTDIQNRFLTFSMFLRISFMMLLAIIIAQPLNYDLLGSSVKTEIDQHKIEESIKLYIVTNKHLIESELENQKVLNQKITNKLNADDISLISVNLQLIKNKINRDSVFVIDATKKLNQLKKIDNRLILSSSEKLKKNFIINDLERQLNGEIATDISFVATLNSISISGYFNNDFKNFKSKMISLMYEKISNYNKLNELLNKSNFYVKTIQILLVENPLSWFITSIVCLVFLLPIYFKYKARDISTKIFQLENHKPEIIKLRNELINTTDFNWLENKIISININQIKTSDYYFMRMLIEHKTILIEYNQTKDKFSKILTDNVKQYNKSVRDKLDPLLNKLKSINLKRYLVYQELVNTELKDEIIVKYEHWLDMPFRTIREKKLPIINTEVGLLDFVYNNHKEGTEEI